MNKVKIKDGKLLYHQTALRNLESILQNGLLSRKLVLEKGISFKDVADPNIISERDDLDGYVLFHFHPRTVFDYKIRGKNPQERFVYICVRRSYAEQNNTFVLPAHPLSKGEILLYPYQEGLSKIDWETMEKTQNETGYNAQVRMAECLFADVVPATSFHSVYVKDDEDRKIVEQLKAKHNQQFYVNIRKDYF